MLSNYPCIPCQELAPWNETETDVDYTQLEIDEIQRRIDELESLRPFSDYPDEDEREITALYEQIDELKGIY